MNSPPPDADPESVARAICLRLLSARARTRAELATALRRREVPDHAAEAVLDRFSEVGLIDDASFAAAWVTSRHAGRGLAGRALAGELRSRGVAAETVAQAVAGLDHDTELATARRLVHRRLPALGSLDRQVQFRRLAAMLARRGYSGELAIQAVREELATPRGVAR
ncbi:MAG: recombination regulator RecX [Actinomycetota bacterium]|nr:recombination regulator RecX [Actinomycetota bacterium]